jgi:hypothetical protein
MLVSLPGNFVRFLRVLSSYYEVPKVPSKVPSKVSSFDFGGDGTPK